MFSLHILENKLLTKLIGCCVQEGNKKNVEIIFNKNVEIIFNDYNECLGESDIHPIGQKKLF